MVQVSGVYDNGKITLDKDIAVINAAKVIVSFADEDVIVEKEYPNGHNFSFAKGREILKNLKSSLSDEVIAERRNEP